MVENQARLRGYVGFYCPEEFHDGSPVEICQAFELGLHFVERLLALKLVVATSLYGRA